MPRPPLYSAGFLINAGHLLQHLQYSNVRCTPQPQGTWCCCKVVDGSASSDLDTIFIQLSHKIYQYHLWKWFLRIGSKFIHVDFSIGLTIKVNLRDGPLTPSDQQSSIPYDKLSYILYLTWLVLQRLRGCCWRRMSQSMSHQNRVILHYTWLCLETDHQFSRSYWMQVRNMEEAKVPSFTKCHL